MKCTGFSRIVALGMCAQQLVVKKIIARSTAPELCTYKLDVTPHPPQLGEGGDLTLRRSNARLVWTNFRSNPQAAGWGKRGDLTQGKHTSVVLLYSKNPELIKVIFEDFKRTVGQPGRFVRTHRTYGAPFVKEF